MRQAGVLAAAGIIAVRISPEAGSRSPKRAARLAEGIRQIPGLYLPFGQPASNMVFVGLDSGTGLTAAELAARLKQEGLRVGVVAPDRFRLVFHYWISDEDVDRVLDGYPRVLTAA